MAVARIYQDGQWVPVNQGSPEMVSHGYLEQELAGKADFDHFHDERYLRRQRFSLGASPVPVAAGDYVLAFTSSGHTASVNFASLTGNYPATGMLPLSSIDLMMGTKNWRARGFYNISAGDTRNMYFGIVGANISGTYGLTSSGVVSPTGGSYPAGTDDGALAQPRSVGGSGHKLYSYRTPWARRDQLAADAKDVYGAYMGTVDTIVTIGWYAETGIEIEPY